MKKNQIHVTCVVDIQESQSTTVFIEILEKKDLEKFKEFTLPKSVIQYAMKNLEKDKKDREKTLIFSVEIERFSKIYFFFPSKESLMDDRSTLFQSIPTKSLFFPAIHTVEAHEALYLATYKYQVYLTEKKEQYFEIRVKKDEKEAIEKRLPLYEAIFEARDLINQPPSDMYPEAMVQHIQKHAWKHFDVHIFDHHELKKLGCNLILAVGAGSDFPPYMVVLTPKKQQKGEKYALIGKGVTFDAGGIQIKPDTAMLDMKCDMSGAAGMIGVAKYLDSLPELPANIVIAVGITENMTGGKAYKPLDIYKAYNGTTVEIHHTDAEGRLVLADVMSYVEDTYKVDHIITMATLTGACVYALGHDIAGIMGDDEEVIQSLLDADSPYEPLWRLPLNEKLKKSLKTDIADLKNVARSEKAGSSIGGAFLSYFQGKAKLTHLDIAGPAYRETTWGYMPKGGTGWGVRILSDFLCSQRGIKSPKRALGTSSK